METPTGEKIFADGIMFNRPHAKAPSFVKGSLSLKVVELTTFMNKHSKNGWVNLSLKESKGGKLYLELDTWTPNATVKPNPAMVPATETVPYPTDTINPSDIPFNQNR